MKEIDFLNQICLDTLYSNKSVKYVGVIDNNRKLLAGKFRNELQNSMIKNPPNRCNNNKCCSPKFYFDILGFSNFELVLGSNVDQHISLESDTMELVVIPLTSHKDKYLCIYLEPKILDQKMVAKLSNIF